MIPVVLRLEAVLVLIAAGGLVFPIPVRRSRRVFADVSEPAGPDPAAEPALRNGSRARAVARRGARIADCLPWLSTCLVRAMAGALLLGRRRIREAVIRFGVRKHHGRMEAHAWLLPGPEILLGGEDAAALAPIADLGRHAASGKA